MVLNSILEEMRKSVVITKRLTKKIYQRVYSSKNEKRYEPSNAKTLQEIIKKMKTDGYNQITA